MKQPDEIKNALDLCSTSGCPDCAKCAYDGDECCLEEKSKDSLAYIQQLEDELQREKDMHQYTIDAANVMKDEALKLEARLAQVERERDACIADMKQFQGVTCNACKHHYRPQPEVRHYECEIFGKFSDIFENEEGPLMCGKFEWRGPCPENTKEETK